MDLAQKITKTPIICGIDIDFSAAEVPSYFEDFNPFYNTGFMEADPQPVYFGKGTVSFSESAVTTDAGLVYTQKIAIKFPATDIGRPLRIEAFRKTKFIRIRLSGDQVLVFGRNDYLQNKKPELRIQSDEKLTTIEFTTRSMAPIGFGESPELIEAPLNFIKLIP